MENNFTNAKSVYIGKQIDNRGSNQVNISEGNSTQNIKQNNDNSSLSGIDMDKLLEELSVLKNKLAKKELYMEANAIKEAIDEKEKNNRFRFLNKAGMKALEMSQTVSLPVATAALAKALGVEV